MAEFNPDSYLSGTSTGEEFNPDDYLSGSIEIQQEGAGTPAQARPQTAPIQDEDWMPTEANLAIQQPVKPERSIDYPWFRYRNSASDNEGFPCFSPAGPVFPSRDTGRGW